MKFNWILINQFAVGTPIILEKEKTFLYEKGIKTVIDLRNSEDLHQINHQEYIEFGAGPEFLFGEFKKKYFDYTRISLFPSYKLKSGESMFKFDQISDLFTLNLAFDQQLYGPLLLKTDATLNLDKNSQDYGDFISSKISISLKKRKQLVPLT